LIRTYVNLTDPGELIHSKQRFPCDGAFPGMRVLDEKNRIIYQLTDVGFKEYIVNKACMRDIEVVILFDAVRVFI